MKRKALYSESRPVPVRPQEPEASPQRPSAGAADRSEPPPPAPAGTDRSAGLLRRFASRHERLLIVGATALLTALAVLAVQRGGPAPKPLTQADIDRAVLHTLNNKTLPSPAAKAAAVVGKRIAEKAKAIGVETVAFDRSGFRFHGRVKALAEAAREGGLKF